MTLYRVRWHYRDNPRKRGAGEWRAFTCDMDAWIAALNATGSPIVYSYETQESE